MAMIFSLISALKESAEQLIAERAGAEQAVHEEERRAAEAEENRKFEGTKVTRETFLAWRERFVVEMEEERKRRDAEREEEARRKRVPKEERKLSGRELWERGLVGKVVEDEEEEEGVDGLEGVKDLKVDS